MTDFTPCPRTVELCAKVVEEWDECSPYRSRAEAIRALIKEQDDE